MNDIKTTFDEEFDYYGFEYEEKDLEVKWVVNEAMANRQDKSLLTFNPSDIREVYYFQNGEKDEESWLITGRLKNGLYFFFESSCDFTGFDCRGSATVILACEWKSLVFYGLDGRLRDKHTL